MDRIPVSGATCLPCFDYLRKEGRPQTLYRRAATMSLPVSRQFTHYLAGCLNAPVQSALVPEAIPLRRALSGIKFNTTEGELNEILSRHLVR